MEIVRTKNYKNILEIVETPTNNNLWHQSLPKPFSYYTTTRKFLGSCLTNSFWERYENNRISMQKSLTTETALNFPTANVLLIVRYELPVTSLYFAIATRMSVGVAFRKMLSFFLNLLGAVKSFCKKGVLRNFSKFTGKHLYQSLFFNKVADWGLQPY